MGDPHPAPQPAPPARWVLLRHELPDSSWHFDWMLERPVTRLDRRLLTFRLEQRPDFAPGARFTGLRLGDHRAAYLDFEGEVSGGRGRVRRVDAGQLLRLSDDGGTLECQVLVGPHARLIRGQAARGTAWGFLIGDPQSPGAP
mgnify:CR=1 FL=1